VLLGFAATDFVITMTLSAADAAKHAGENPFLHFAHPELLGGWRSTLAAQGNFPLLIAGALPVFLKLALGLSGFETGVSSCRGRLVICRR
jgi:hypothetical protein